jgi:hypothetical protein
MRVGKGDDDRAIIVSVQLLDTRKKPLMNGDRRGRATPLGGAVTDHIEALQSRQSATNAALVRIRRAQRNQLVQPHAVVAYSRPP